MQISAIQEPKDALNKAFRKQAIEEAEFEQFQESIASFIAEVQKAGESKATEENIKTLLRNFLKVSKTPNPPRVQNPWRVE